MPAMVHSIVLAAVVTACVSEARRLSQLKSNVLGESEDLKLDAKNLFSLWAIPPGSGLTSFHSLQSNSSKNDDNLETIIMKQRWRQEDVPKVYVYDVPGFEIHRKKEEVLGEKEFLDIVRDGVQYKVPVRAVDQYEAGDMYYYYLKNSKHRTMNPDEADIFYVPLAHIHIGWSAKNDHLWDIAPAIAENLPKVLHHLNKDTANRHVQIAGHTGDLGCEYWYSKLPLLAPMFRLSLEHFESKGLKNYRSIIYPTVASGISKKELKSIMSAAAAGPRPYLVFSLFGQHGSNGAVVLRHRLSGQCTEDHGCMNNISSPLAAADVKVRHNLYLQSTFCLEPPGDSPSRKAMVDVMIAGCIPVLFWKNQTELWPYHVRWDKVSILLEPESHHKAIDVLKAIPNNKIRELRENIINLIPLLSYKEFGSMDTYNDAVDATLVGLWKDIRASAS
mmetsp:Transcript_29690/g.72324  ORF Transcript_29690/g.72324 Transcript_29690/m.72324 type:complete len:446 (+) Transcript_29690:61-1398(+)